MRVAEMHRLFVGVGVAFALTGVSATAYAVDNTIFACVNNASGTVKIVRAGTVCSTNETLKSWNIVGPTGATGPAGSVAMLARMNAIPHTFDQALTYGAPSGISVANVDEDSVSMISPNTTLTATNLVVSLTVEVNNNSARRFTLRVNGTDTALSCTVAGLTSSCTSTAEVTVPPQSLLSIKSDRPATFNADPTEARIAFQLTE